MLLSAILATPPALPHIQRELSASFSQLQWVPNAFLVVQASLLLTAGSLADRNGRRRFFLIGTTIFAIGELACGLSRSPTALDLSSGLAGAGSALVFGPSLALLTTAFSGRARAAAFSAWGTTVAMSYALAPVLGGALVEAFGWRAVFLALVPLAVVTLVITLLRVPESRDRSPGRADVVGVLLFGSGLMLAMYVLVNGNAHGWTSAQIVVPALASVALMGSFGAWERRIAYPMLDLALLRDRTFAGAAVAVLALSAAFYGLIFYVMIYLQRVLGFSPVAAGARFATVTVVAFVVSLSANALMRRISARVLVGTALTAFGAGALLLAGLDVRSGYGDLIAGLALAGFGIGLANAPLAATAAAAAPTARSGMATATSNTFRPLGSAIGIAALGAVFQARVHATLVLPRAASSDTVAAIASGNFQQIAGDANRAAARVAYISGLNALLIVIGVVAFLGAAAAFGLMQADPSRANVDPAAVGGAAGHRAES